MAVLPRVVARLTLLAVPFSAARFPQIEQIVGKAGETCYSLGTAGARSSRQGPRRRNIGGKTPIKNEVDKCFSAFYLVFALGAERS